MARIAFFLILSTVSAQGWSETRLTGTWQYYAYRYRGSVQPPGDASLILRFQFNTAGIDDLSWTDDSGTSCERRATYKQLNGEIEDHVSWVNPQNSADCASDPNMQPDVDTQFVYRLVNGHLEIDVDLGAEAITYLWRKTKD